MKNINQRDGAEDVNNILPTHCPACGSILEYDMVHLSCPNDICPGRIAKQLAGAIKVLDIKRVGEKTIEPFAKGFSNMYEVIVFVLTCENDPKMENFGIKLGTRSHEIFVNAFKNIRSLTYEQVIQMLGYDNVGNKISTQLAREHAGLDFDYAHLEKALVEKLRSQEVSDYIKYVVKGLEGLGITIDRPKNEEKSLDRIGVVMTGSPKAFGYATKEAFLAKFPNMYDAKKLKAGESKYLITDDLNSTTSKMEDAKKKGIEIKTYGEF
ncbi:MAG: hypothetical protein M0R03_23520 [Novosphingobium sp.]|nr:hypothetical protein [Novosphingobium sp.]